MNCRNCESPLEYTFLDLGFAPPSNALLTLELLNRPELTYPLRVKICHKCWLLQTEDFAARQTLFAPDYPYFSSTSSSWCAHAKRFCNEIVRDLGLSDRNYVVEIGSNDGYLLRNFLSLGIPCLGIEPTAGAAAASEKLGIPVVKDFFGEALARRLADVSRRADLIVANNVYAHVPDIKDFTRGIKALLNTGGTATLEFPHVLELVEHIQFDTIYHEHYSYLSLHVVIKILAAADLRVLHAEKLSTHGGSLRIHACHDADSRATSKAVGKILDEESRRGLTSLRTYLLFQERVTEIKNNLLDFLIMCKRTGRKVVAYGAAAKGNTLLNYAGIKPDLIPLVFDAAPSKQGRFLPGSHIPIRSPAEIAEVGPDIVLVLPWNIFSEVAAQLKTSLPNNVEYKSLEAFK